MVSRDGVSAVGTAADAPPARDKERPTPPTIGMACLRRLGFEATFLYAIAETPH
jgi:hypothetical protein